VRAIRKGDLDRIAVPEAPLDILAQQIVAMCAAEDGRKTNCSKPCAELSVSPYLRARTLTRSSKCFPKAWPGARGRYAAYLHRDRVNGMVRARRGSRLAAITSGGAIPENSLYTVIAQPEGAVVGTVDEDFAV